MKRLLWHGDLQFILLEHSSFCCKISFGFSRIVFIAVTFKWAMWYLEWKWAHYAAGMETYGSVPWAVNFCHSSGREDSAETLAMEILGMCDLIL